MWDLNDDLVGLTVIITNTYQEEMKALVLAVNENGHLKVKLKDGTVMIGNQWEEE